MSKRILDLFERVGLTFVGAFIAVYMYGILTGGSTVEALSSKELLDQALTAGVAAIVPLVSGLIGFKVGDKNTASIVSVKKKEEPVTEPPQESPAPLYRFNDEG